MMPTRDTDLIIMIIITFKGTIRDFFIISLLRCELSKHACSSGLCANVCKSHATHRALIMCSRHVVCYVVRSGSSAIRFDRVQLAFVLTEFLLAEPLTDKGEEETGIPRENPWR